jgi:hypothetical protein
MTVSVSWIPFTRFYAFIRSTGETEAVFALRFSHYTRYLILNFGNVINLGINMWYVGSSFWIPLTTSDSLPRAINVRYHSARISHL